MNSASRERISHFLSHGHAVRQSGLRLSICQRLKVGVLRFCTLLSVGDTSNTGISIVDDVAVSSRHRLDVRFTDKLEKQRANESEDNAVESFQTCRNVQGSKCEWSLGWVMGIMLDWER
jgi:hypothetical protein